MKKHNVQNEKVFWKINYVWELEDSKGNLNVKIVEIIVNY